MSHRPTPTALKKLAGNPGKRAYNTQEIEPTLGAPACPAWLTGHAREEWNRIVPELDRLGVLTTVDNSVLIGHCATYGEIADTVEAKQPLKSSLLGQMRAYACELGLTPAARAKLAIPKRPEEDDIDKFFTKH